MSSKPRLPNWYDAESDEEARVVAHPHVFVYWKGILTGLVLFAAAFWTVWSGRLEPYLTQTEIHKVAASIGLFGLLIVVYEYMDYVTTWYIVTSEKVVKHDGIFKNWRRSIDPLRIDSIQDTQLEQSMTQLVFSAGNLEVLSSGSGGVDLVFENLPRAKKVQDLVETLRSMESESEKRREPPRSDGDSSSEE